jgi:TonB family protein
MTATSCPSCEAVTDTASRSCESCGEPLPVSPGWVIAERYEIQARLGEGGMGAVFRARDRALRVTVAFKVLRLKADPSAVRRFHHEVTLARKVRHENVCAVYEYGEDGGILYCTMELVGGKNLRQVLREQAPLAVDRAYQVALKAAAGLRAIHEAGVLHRDLKASNIMIDTKERVRLVDFGIAKAMPAPEEDASTTETPITGRDAVLGTPAYMSPEQVMGWPLDPRSDIYSFGIVLFELFTGEVPFHGGSRAATMRKHLEEPPPLHGPLAQSLPTPLVHVLARALAKDPDRRYADVAELIGDLERARDSFRTDTLDAVPAALPLRWLLPAFVLVAGVAFFELTGQHPAEDSRPVPSTIPPPTPSVAMVPPSPTLRPIPTAKPSRLAANPRPGPPGPPPTVTTTSTTTTTTVPPTTLAPVPTTTVPTMMAAVPPTTIPSKPVETRPQCLSCPPPPYPPAAEKYGLVGSVELEVTIDEKGNVTGTRVLRGHSAFRAAAGKVVRGWRFVPAKRDGVPIKYTLRQVVEFTQAAPR